MTLLQHYTADDIPGVESINLTCSCMNTCSTCNHVVTIINHAVVEIMEKLLFYGNVTNQW